MPETMSELQATLAVLEELAVITEMPLTEYERVIFDVAAALAARLAAAQEALRAVHRMTDPAFPHPDRCAAIEQTARAAISPLDSGKDESHDRA